MFKNIFFSVQSKNESKSRSSHAQCIEGYSFLCSMITTFIMYSENIMVDMNFTAFIKQDDLLYLLMCILAATLSVTNKS